MKTKPTTVLLAIIAVLLAGNLIVNLPEATAQTHLKAPHVIQVEVGLSPVGINARDYRLWSDGVIEEAVFDDLNACVPVDPPTGFAWQEIPESVPPPGVRITRIYTRHSGSTLLRLRSDGVLEQN